MRDRSPTRRRHTRRDACAGALMQLDLEPSLAPVVEAGQCPHLAMLLASYEQVAPALASFYALGAKRNGWMFHRSLPGRGAEDRGALSAAGLAVVVATRRRSPCTPPA